MPAGPVLCVQCDKPEYQCTCDKYCTICKNMQNVRLCMDGLYYCPDCREACDVTLATLVATEPKTYRAACRCRPPLRRGRRRRRPLPRRICRHAGRGLPRISEATIRACLQAFESRPKANHIIEFCRFEDRVEVIVDPNIGAGCHSSDTFGQLHS